MSSINTNASAMTALQTLNTISKNMATTQSRISTGFRVGEASDNAAYWSIATTMRSDNKALSTVQDALGLGAGQIDTAYTAMSSAIDVVDAIKQKLVSAVGKSADEKAKIQTEITNLQNDLAAKALASFAGENWLNINTDATAGTGTDDVTESIVSSFDRAGDGSVSVGKIDVAIYNGTSGETIALYDANATLADNKGILSKALADAAGDALVGADGTTAIDMSVSDLNITDDNVDDATIEAMLKAVDGALAEMTTAASTLGAAKSRVDMQKDFVSKLSDAIERGVGQLVDADMNEESARLSALQVQQQLGIQALSIANSNSQNILSLFR